VNDLKDAPPTSVLQLADALVCDGSMEGRQVAYELLEFHRKTRETLRSEDIERLRQGLDNWASVDSFAMSVAGPAFRRGVLSDARVDAWSQSDDRFLRRLALVCTVSLNTRSRGGTGDVARTLRLCTRLAADRDDFVVKALSWALRGLLPHDDAAVRAFLSQHEATLHRRILREVRAKLETGRKSR
jgi:3-methyladenine DNA glycosylase AlkD